jgi:hypothetical protein
LTITQQFAGFSRQIAQKNCGIESFPRLVGIFLGEKVVIQGVYRGIHSAENHLITRITCLSA